MPLSDHIAIDRMHHAYLIEGSHDEVLLELKELLAHGKAPVHDDLDFHVYRNDAFLLEHAHELRHEQSMHAAEGGRKIFVVSFNTMLSEAQNALLKTLEEPTEGTHFFFITRTGEILLPTVRSRMQVIMHHTQENAAHSSKGDIGSIFVSATIPERLKMIERYTKAKKEDKGEAKEEARKFLESLERALYGSKHEQEFARSLADIIHAKQYLSDRSPSVKILLEHLALTMPSMRNGSIAWNHPGRLA